MEPANSGFSVMHLPWSIQLLVARIFAQERCKCGPRPEQRRTGSNGPGTKFGRFSSFNRMNVPPSTINWEAIPILLGTVDPPDAVGRVNAAISSTHSINFLFLVGILQTEGMLIFRPRLGYRTPSRRLL